MRFEARALSREVVTCIGVACCAAFDFGFQLAVVNGPMDRIASDLGFAESPQGKGLVVSSLLAGAAVGSLGGSALSDRFGRRKAFFLVCVPLLLGPFLCATATDLSSLMLGRALTGLGVGVTSGLVPLYISEVSPPPARGVLGSLNQLVISVGLFAALVLNALVPPSKWRSLLASGLLPAVALGAGMLWCLESPASCALRGDGAGAQASAAALWGSLGGAYLAADVGSAQEPESGAEEQRLLAQESGTGVAGPELGSPGSQGGTAVALPAAHSQASPAPSWAEMLAHRGAQTGMALYLLQQLGGINAITYFSTSILQAAGVRSATLGSAALGACSCAATVAAAGLIDRLGRRRLLELSYGGMALSALLIGLALHWQHDWPTLSSGVTLGATVAYILAFGVGSGPVTGLLVPELVPARLRARGVSLAFGSHWVCNFVVGQCFLPAADRWGVATLFFFFAAVCGLATKFVSCTLVGDKFAA